MARGLIAGFLAGVVLTLILAGSTAYYVYTQLSPNGVQQMVETRLVSLLGEGATVGSAHVNLPNLITLSNISIANTTGTISVGSAQVTFPNQVTLGQVSITNATGSVFSAGQIEAVAEGGMAGLQKGRFVELVLTDPVLALEKRHGHWNLRDLIDPLVARAAALANATPVSSASAAAQPAQPGIPLKAVQVKGLKLTITMENQPLQQYEIENLVCSRETSEAPWTLLCQGTRIHLNSATEEFPFGDLVNSMKDLVPSRKEEPQAPGSAKQPWLAGVTLDNTSLELTYPQQRIIVEGISFQADQLFEVLKLQTGSLEKKNVPPGT